VARKYVLDTNCYIDAAGDPAAHTAFAAFCDQAAPGLFLSSVVAAELRAGAADARTRRVLEERVIGPFLRRGRVLTPSAGSWDMLGTALSLLQEREGLRLAQVPRSFVFDILLAHSCREAGAILVSRNTRDLGRIATVFAFEHVTPYPAPR
jgi:predicted nucleic acid-binding protein